MINLLGRQMGEWTVLAFAGVHEKRAYWFCRCSCGGEYEVPGSALIRARSRRCRTCALRANAKIASAAARSKTAVDFSPGRHIPNGARCRCGLLLPCSSCLVGDATKGMGEWS